MAAESLSPQIVSRVMAEIRQLVKNPLNDIEYIESDTNAVSEIHCYIAGPADTPYFGSKFRVKLVLGEDYPTAPPRGYFLTKIYHPNISNTGDICVNTLKRDWRPDVTISHVFQVIRCLLIIPFPESSLNDEAGKLFMDSFDEFARRARLMSSVHGVPISSNTASSGSVPVAAIAVDSSQIASKKVSSNDDGKTVIDENSSENVNIRQEVAVKKAPLAPVDAKKKSLRRL